MEAPPVMLGGVALVPEAAGPVAAALVAAVLALGLALVEESGLRTLYLVLADVLLRKSGQSLPFDYMGHTVGNENVRSNNTNAIYENVSIVDGDGQAGSVDSLESSPILQTRAVAWGASDNDMVGENLGDLIGRKSGKR